MTVQGAPSLPPFQRIGLVGEFSVGKTTLANGFLPEMFRLPTGPLPLSSTPLVVRYGKVAALEGVLEKRLTRLNPSELADILLAKPPLFDALRLSIPCDSLKSVILCDIHGLDDAESIERAAKLLGKCSQVAWLTLGTQAWKRSESVAWRSLTARIKGARKMLLVTHADLMTAVERDRVRQRLSTLTPRIFDEVQFVGKDVQDAPGVISADRVRTLFGLSQARRDHLPTQPNPIVRRPADASALSPPALPLGAVEQAGDAQIRPTRPRGRLTSVRRPLTARTARPSASVPSAEHKDAVTLSTNAQAILDGIKSDVAGFISAAIVDSDEGVALARADDGSGFDVGVAAAANAEVVKAKLHAMKALKLTGNIEDILITLAGQYHLIRPLQASPTVFLYLAVDRGCANLAMARHSLKNAEADLNL